MKEGATMSIHFVTFGDSVKYGGTLKRIAEEAKNTKAFESINVFTEKTLDRDFLITHAPFIAKHSRGFGYWIWKPQVIQQVMQAIPMQDFIVYADAGCSFKWTSEAKSRFYEYIELVRGHQCNMLTFRLPKELRECSWTKMDTMAYVTQADEDIMNSPQIMATAIIMQKTPFTQEFIKEWIAVCTADKYHYVTDAPSVLPNHPMFREHRHDQSCFSLLAKKYKLLTIDDETYHIDWHKKNWPIHASRLRY